MLQYFLPFTLKIHPLVFICRWSTKSYHVQISSTALNMALLLASLNGSSSFGNVIIDRGQFDKIGTEFFLKCIFTNGVHHFAVAENRFFLISRFMNMGIRSVIHPPQWMISGGYPNFFSRSKGTLCRIKPSAGHYHQNHFSLSSWKTCLRLKKSSLSRKINLQTGIGQRSHF